MRCRLFGIYFQNLSPGKSDRRRSDVLELCLSGLRVNQELVSSAQQGASFQSDPGIGEPSEFPLQLAMGEQSNDE